MRLIDEQFLETPWYGSRQMARHLRRNGWCVGRHRVRRLMIKMGLAPIYQHPKTSEPHPRHKVYPYLLRHLTIDRPNHVWCADVTYIPMRRGFLYLVAIMDWASRKVLAWRLSNTMDADFCVAALEEAIARHGKPGHLQHRSGLAVHQLRLHQHPERTPASASPWMAVAAGWTTSSSSGCGDRSNTNACSSTPSRPAARHEPGSDAGSATTIADRPHSAFGGRTPDEVYATQENEEKLAA